MRNLISIATLAGLLAASASPTLARGGGGGGGHMGGGFAGGGAHYGGFGGTHAFNAPVARGYEGGRPGYGYGLDRYGYGYPGWGYGYGGIGYGGYGGYGPYGYGGGYGGGGYTGYNYPWGNGYNSGYTQPQNDPVADYNKQAAAAADQAREQTPVVSTYGNAGTTASAQIPTDFGMPMTNLSVSAARFESPAAIVDEANTVRDNFHGSGVFIPAWWKGFPNAWFNPAWSPDWVWQDVDWPTLAGFWGVPSKQDPAEYDANSAASYQSALALAEKGAQKVGTKPAPPAESDWQPFGVFSLVHTTEKNSTMLFQVAVNKQGQLRGNCYSILNGSLEPLSGEIDKATGRAAFIVGKNKSVVYESGLGNLLSAQSPIVVHLDSAHSSQLMFVRLRQVKL